MDQPQFMLYTYDTPNGVKVSSYLEELKDVYGLTYEFHCMNLLAHEQKSDWFLKLNPNGRVPVLVDRKSKANKREEYIVFESAAILLYLAENYDTLYRYHFEDPALRSDSLQWIFFSHGGVGPIQGQAHHFVRYAPVDIPYAKKRYLDETKRLYGVLNTRLEGREFLVGEGKGKYSIADMNCVPWVRCWEWAGVDSMLPFPNVVAWMQRIEARPAFQRGADVPFHSELPKNEQEAKEKIEMNQIWQGLK
ncbi:glutathione S-transferase [Dacryopinax primogenitus]|uniref:Glutathione S-transferase n=1 Tax=Dacryopinax primogenitus (strain DJM 731) TaxID=1858805 RepID=M5FVC5_DACPD|nr:glutathione S-transferase [Dacryopinax primogenitus]EJT99564.1 glutathione S-transferase [Dacryopinax primogenitus]